MRVLGIETTCDETACAVVEEGRLILSNVIASQIDLHQQYGGVVPELACRRHIDLVLPVIHQALEEASLSLEEIDLLAVAYGPGLIGALLIGLSTAKALALALNKPFVGVNHVEAHLYAALMSHPHSVSFPCLGVILSGGHTTLLLMKEIGSYVLIGQTVDDAIGEAFDKAAKLLGLPYPGGPYIEKLAQGGNSEAYALKAGQVKGAPFNFSFSGLKTALLYTLRGRQGKEAGFALTEQEKKNLAASFQRAAFDDVIEKTLSAAHQYGVHSILFGGGVTNSQTLRERFLQKDQGRHELIWPSFGLSLDNAAMIAGLGYHSYRRKGKSDSFDLDPLTRIPFD